MDVMEKRKQITHKVQELIKNGTCLCWTEILTNIKDDINEIAKATKLDPTYIGFSVIDDVEAELDQEEPDGWA